MAKLIRSRGQDCPHTLQIRPGIESVQGHSSCSCYHLHWSSPPVML